MILLELAKQSGLNPQRVASTNGGEYHAACPMCGGKDRFFIQPNRQMSKCVGSYCCRQCGVYGDTIQYARQFLNISFKQASQLVGLDYYEPTRKILLETKTRSYKPFALLSPPKEWIEQATLCVEKAHYQILNMHNALAFLEKRGLPFQAVQQYKIGWIDRDCYFNKKEWGLEKEHAQYIYKANSLWIPQGILIPTIEASGNAIRLKVRRYDCANNQLPKYIAISGSMNGLSIIGNTQHKTMIVLESELDAYAVHHAVNDSAFVVAVGSNIKNPDNVTDNLAKKALNLIICHDNDEAGKKMLIKWQTLYSHAISLPAPSGKDIGEAIQKGLDIRAWLSANIFQR